MPKWPAGLLFILPFAASAAPELASSVDIEAVNVTDGVYMLRARGGNIGVSIGDDGIFLIDDQFAPLTPKIHAKLEELSAGKPVRFVLNTHVHFDHTGGNENQGKAGAVIVAHENVRRRMDTEAFRKEFIQYGGENPARALPVVTFNDRITFHINGRTLATRHYPDAHTDGDSVIWFEEDNIVHMGDLFFQIGYPFIDLDRGGSIDGLLRALDDILRKADARTVVMPGHGAISDKAGLQEYRDMLADLRAKVGAEVRSGKRLDEVLAMKLTEKYDARWSWDFISGERLIETLYTDLVRRNSSARQDSTRR